MDLAEGGAPGSRRITRRRMLQGLAGTTVGLALAQGMPELPPGKPVVLAAPASTVVWAWLTEGDTASLASLQHHAGTLTHLSPTWFSMGEDLAIIGQPDQLVVDFAVKHGISLHPLINNAGFDPRVAQSILAAPQRRATAAEHIATLVLNHNFAGINLDFEGQFGASRDQYSDLVERIARLLRPAGKWVTVDVVATTRPPGQVPATSWAAPYDYRRLAAAADAVVVMAYDYSVQQPGPISPLWWVEEVIAYARTVVPAGKLVVGLPFYGRHWVVTNHGTTEIGLPGTDALTLLAWSGAKLLRPLHVVHFEDAASLGAKLRSVGAGTAGVAFWRLGMDAPPHWPVIRTWLRTER
jgi:spore germination protein